MKYLSFIVLIMLFLFGMVWTFNHINAWLAFAIGIAGIAFVILYTKQKTK